MSFLIWPQHNTKISMISRLCCLFVTELIVSNCCPLFCPIVFIIILCFVWQAEHKLWSALVKVCSDPFLAKSQNWYFILYFLCASVLLNVFLTWILVLSWLILLLIIWLYSICFLESPQPHAIFSVLGLFVFFFFPCDVPLGYLSCKHKFDCYLCNPGSCWCLDRMMKPSLCLHNFIYFYFFLPTPPPTFQQIRSWAVQTYPRSLSKVCLLWLWHPSTFCCLAKSEQLILRLSYIKY